MSNEQLLTEVNETVDKLKDLITKLTAAIAPPATPPAPPAAETGALVKLTMTEKANGMTYEQYIDAGWTDQQMIDNGIAIAAPAGPPSPPTDENSGIPSPPAATITAEQLNEIMIAEYNRLGENRAPIDAALKELGVTGITELPVEKYQELIDKVKSIKNV